MHSFYDELQYLYCNVMCLSCGTGFLKFRLNVHYTSVYIEWLDTENISYLNLL